VRTERDSVRACVRARWTEEDRARAPKGKRERERELRSSERGKRVVAAWQSCTSRSTSSPKSAVRRVEIRRPWRVRSFVDNATDVSQPMTNRCRPARARHLPPFLRTSPTRGRDAPSRVSSQLVGAAARVRDPRLARDEREACARYRFEIPAARPKRILVRYERECFSHFPSIHSLFVDLLSIFFLLPQLGRGRKFSIITPI